MFKSLKRFTCRRKYKDWEEENLGFYNYDGWKQYKLVCKDCGKIVRRKRVKDYGFKGITEYKK